MEEHFSRVFFSNVYFSLSLISFSRLLISFFFFNASSVSSVFSSSSSFSSLFVEVNVFSLQKSFILRIQKKKSLEMEEVFRIVISFPFLSSPCFPLILYASLSYSRHHRSLMCNPLLSFLLYFVLLSSYLLTDRYILMFFISRVYILYIIQI